MIATKQDEQQEINPAVLEALSFLPMPIQTIIKEFLTNIRSWTAALAAGQMALDKWFDLMFGGLARNHIAAFMVGLGDTRITPQMIDLIARTVEFHQGYLENFRADIGASGGDFKPQWHWRAGLYGLSTKQSYWEGEVTRQAGRPLPLPAMPGQGTTCLTNCGCEWEIRVIDEEAGDYDAYWKRTKRDSCQVCLQREEDWNPIRIRGMMLQSTIPVEKSIHERALKHLQGKHNQETHGRRGGGDPGDVDVPGHPIKWNRDKGHGAVPYQHSVRGDANYAKYTTLEMTPEDFLALNPGRPTRSSFLGRAAKEGAEFAPPWLDVKWDGKAGQWNVISHEGRGRAQVAADLAPGKPIKVDLMLRGGMYRGDITPQMRRAPIISDKRKQGRTFVFDTDNPDIWVDFRESTKERALKHLGGKHPQKRHGWRFGSNATLSGRKRIARNQGEEEWGEYKRRAQARSGKKPAAPKPKPKKAPKPAESMRPGRAVGSWSQKGPVGPNGITARQWRARNRKAYEDGKISHKEKMERDRAADRLAKAEDDFENGLDWQASQFLNDGVTGAVDGEKYETWDRSAFHQRGRMKAEIVDKIAKDSGVDPERVNDIIGGWAETSNNGDMRSLSMQKAVAEELGLELSDWQKGLMNKLETRRDEFQDNFLRDRNKFSDEPLSEQEARDYFRSTAPSLYPHFVGGRGTMSESESMALQRKVARSMYNHTQERLREYGYKPGDTVVLFRGVNRDIGKSGKVQYKGNAMESWSVSDLTASDFGSTVLRMEVPIENIIGTSVSGFGCLPEGEFVIAGNIEGTIAEIWGGL